MIILVFHLILFIPSQGGGNVLYIDPYPDGLSNEGTVIVKGDLQVDGTTTTVDSFNVTIK